MAEDSIRRCRDMVNTDFSETLHCSIRTPTLFSVA